MRDEFSVRFAKSIEPGIIKVFDFNIQDNPAKIGSDPDVVAKEIRVLSLKDTEFMLDKCNYDDCRINIIDSLLPDISGIKTKKVQRYE
jgi:hypothetical protein